MDKVHSFNQISIETPFKRIYNRLGYRQGLTQLSSRQKEELDGYIDEAVRLLTLKGSGRRIKVIKCNAGALELCGGVIFKGNLVVSVFENTCELLLLGATAGKRIIEAIENSKDKDLTRGVVFDAVASESVDLCLDWLSAYFNRLLKREDKQLTAKRISSGYGDFILENQKIIYEFLELKKLEVSLTDKYMLTPEKSVTAVVGVVETRCIS